MDFRASQKQPERPRRASEPSATRGFAAPDISSPAGVAPSLASKFIIPGLLAMVLFALAVAGIHLLYQPNSPRADRYQVVFLDDNQVFFGKLKNTRGDYLRLEQVYSTQGDKPSQGQSAPASGDISLVKVGDLVYGPEDVMMIRADKVKFWQDLKSDSKISKIIRGQ